jgi:hypothetical protein
MTSVVTTARIQRQTTIDEAFEQMLDGLEPDEQNLARTRLLGHLEAAIISGNPVDVDYYVFGCELARDAQCVRHLTAS